MLLSRTGGKYQAEMGAITRPVSSDLGVIQGWPYYKTQQRSTSYSASCSHLDLFLVYLWVHHFLWRSTKTLPNQLRWEPSETIMHYASSTASELRMQTVVNKRVGRFQEVSRKAKIYKYS